MPTRPTTPAQQEDARRLRAIYQTWLDSSPVRRTQEDVAEAIGASQSTVAQTLSGRLALNATRAAKLAKLFGCSVKDFSSDLAVHITDIAGGFQPSTKPAIGLADNPTAAPIALEFALPVVLDAIRHVAPDCRAELAQVLSLLATNWSHLYAQRAIELLAEKPVATPEYLGAPIAEEHRAELDALGKAAEELHVNNQKQRRRVSGR